MKNKDKNLICNEIIQQTRHAMNEKFDLAFPEYDERRRLITLAVLSCAMAAMRIRAAEMILKTDKENEILDHLVNEFLDMVKNGPDIKHVEH